VKEFVEVPLPDGSSLVVESADIRGGTVAAGRLHDLTKAAAETFDTAMKRLRVAAGSVVKQVRDMPEPPSEVTVQFAVKLATQAGVVIASTTAEANLTVSLKWTATSTSDDLQATVETTDATPPS
jgi:hypothetical protein